MLALRLVSESTHVLTQAPAVKALLGSLTSDLLLELTVGAVLAVVSYSSLAIVLLTATLASTGVIPMEVALGLVLGASTMIVASLLPQWIPHRPLLRDGVVHPE